VTHWTSACAEVLCAQAEVLCEDIVPDSHFPRLVDANCCNKL
jgi:hypothetical protein